MVKKIALSLMAAVLLFTATACEKDEDRSSISSEASYDNTQQITSNEESSSTESEFDEDELHYLSLWSGSFMNDDFSFVLSFRNLDELSVEFAIAPFYDGDSVRGMAEVRLDCLDFADAHPYSFWFMDDNTILLSGGDYEGVYTRDDEVEFDWDYEGSSIDTEDSNIDVESVTGAFYLDGNLDSEDFLEFYDDYTGIWFISGAENAFEYEIEDDLILIIFENDNDDEIEIINENTLYWDSYGDEYIKMHG